MIIVPRTGRTLLHARRVAGTAFAVTLAGGIFLPAPVHAQERTGRVKVQTPWLAATRGFMKIGDIEGESKDEGHDRWIELTSVEWGLGAPPSAGAGQATGEVVIVRKLDKASPRLVETIAEGRKLAAIELHVPAGPDDPEETAYLAYELKNVRITSYSISGAADVPIEEITLQFEAIEWQDRPVMKGQKILEN